MNFPRWLFVPKVSQSYECRLLGEKDGFDSGRRSSDVIFVRARGSRLLARRTQVICRNSREIDLMTWEENAVILRGRAHYGRMDEVAEYVFQFNRTSEGKLLKSGAIAFSKSEDGALARQVIETFMAKN